MAQTRTKTPKFTLDTITQDGKRRKRPLPVMQLPVSLKIPGVTLHTQKKQRDLDLNPPSRIEWAQRFRVLRGQPFHLTRHAPLEALYRDEHTNIVVIKPAQVGISEWALTYTLHALDVGAAYWETEQEGLNVAYLFPTKEALGDFSKERFAKMRMEHPHLKTLFTAYNDVTFKQAGASFLYLRGASSVTALLSFPADVLILDEYDRMNKDAIALAQQRLRASRVKRMVAVSTPTLPEIGIHAQYLLSDQHVWEVACTWCNTYNELDFFRDVRLDGEPMEEWEKWDDEVLRMAQVSVHCPACAQKLDPAGPGKWRAKYPERTGMRGYWIPALSFPDVSILQLCLQAVSADPTIRTEFYRSGLGVPYSEHGSRITREMLASLSLQIPRGNPRTLWTKTSMGVDVGKYFHYRITGTAADGKRYVRAMGKAKSFDDLDDLMREYRVRKCVIDALPENHGSQRWAEKYKGRVLRAFYTDNPRDPLYRTQTEKDEKKRTRHKKPEEVIAGAQKQRFAIFINRTMAMDNVYTRIDQNVEHWEQRFHDDQEVIKQMMAPVRVSTVDEQGQEIARWDHTSPDHYYHACVYDVIAQECAPTGLPGVLAQARTRGWNPR